MFFRFEQEGSLSAHVLKAHLHMFSKLELYELHELAHFTQTRVVRRMHQYGPGTS